MLPEADCKVQMRMGYGQTARRIGLPGSKKPLLESAGRGFRERWDSLVLIHLFQALTSDPGPGFGIRVYDDPSGSRSVLNGWLELPTNQQLCRPLASSDQTTSELSEDAVDAGWSGGM
jgi:hypothetical protein